MVSEPVFLPDGDDNLAAQFDAVCQRMAEHASTLVPDGATEDDLDRIAVELTKAALKR